MTLQQIFRTGLCQYKVDRAAQLNVEEVGSLGDIAGHLHIPKADLVREFRSRDIDPVAFEAALREELR